MKIVLLQDVENLGKKFEVKNVKDGYARNFLIPKGLAKLADEKTLKWVEEQQTAIAKKAEQELEQIGKMASQLDGLEVEIPVKVGDKDQLFEKITPQKLSTTLKDMGYDINKNQIGMEDIEELGEFEAKIKFPHNLESNIKIIVTAEE